ncbi:MAG: hypothetical protein HWN71_06140 [Desulfobacterales bacterium]|nr:hypothetical protein [Desulfobacterales bacterium]
MFRVILLTLAFMTFVSEGVSAQELFLGRFEGSPIKINQLEQYLTMDLAMVSRPQMAENDFWKRVFLNREDFGLCKLTATYGKDPSRSRTITPFSYKKISRDNYVYESIGVSEDISYPILPPIVFPFRGSISLDVSICNWEGSENNAAVQKIVEKLTTIPSAATQRLDAVLIALDVLDDLFPPQNKQEILKTSIELEEITRNDLVICSKAEGRQKELLKIRFGVEDAVFSNFDFETPTESEPFYDLEVWRKAIQEAAEEAKRKNDPGPLKSVMLAFSDYTSKLPLVEKDKSLFIAGALHTWIPNYVENCNANYCFKAASFQQIPAGDLKHVRKTKWDFAGVDCDTQACIDFNDFVQKARTIQGREVAIKYLNERLDIFVDQQRKARLTPDQFKETLVITKANYFEANTGGNEIEYVFEPGNIYLELADEEYYNNEVKFYQTFVEGRNIITRVEIESQR